MRNLLSLLHPFSHVRNAVPEVTPEPANDEEEAFSFGPEWLKSLGAASIDDETVTLIPYHRSLHPRGESAFICSTDI